MSRYGSNKKSFCHEEDSSVTKHGNIPLHELLIKLRPDHAGPNVHHPDPPKRHQGNPAQIGNGSQILGNGLELVDLMRKSGRLCSHCSPGAPNKALTGGSAGGGDPRRDQRE